MEKSKRDVVLVGLIDALRARESWCGETHLQKATYFLQEMTGAETGFDFILYKHGPYSFELRDELAMMRADGLVALRMQDSRYGPSIVPETPAEALKQRFPKTLAKHEKPIQFVAERFGKKSVVELERLSTALFVRRELGSNADFPTCAVKINQLKPHVSVDQAKDALNVVSKWEAEVPKA